MLMRTAVTTAITRTDGILGLAMKLFHGCVCVYERVYVRAVSALVW